MLHLLPVPKELHHRGGRDDGAAVDHKAMELVGLRDGVSRRPNNGFNILVGHRLLPVRQGQKAGEGPFQQLAREGIAQLLHPLDKGVFAGVLPQHQVVIVDADGLRGHNLVGEGVFQHPVLVDARLVVKGVAAHHRLVGGYLLADNGGDQAAGAVNLSEVDAGLGLVQLASGIQGHDDLLQGNVAGPLPNAIDSALHLVGPGPNGRQGVGYRHPQIVVAMDRKGDRAAVLLPVEVFPQPGNKLPHLLRGNIPHRVRDIDGGGSGIHSGVQGGKEKFPVATGGVLGGKFHIPAEGAGVGHAFCNHLQGLFPGDV